MDLSNFVLGVPNGSLFNNTVDLLKKIGTSASFDDRIFEIEVKDSGIISKIKIYRPQDIPIAIQRGKIDAGFCGWDCVKEAGMERKIKKITELNYSKKTKKPVDIVLFCKEGSDVDPEVIKDKDDLKGLRGGIVDNKEITVTTEYLKLAKPIFHRANVTFSHGTTEQKVADGLYDYGIGVSETGISLQKNGLKIVKKILESPTVLMARKKTPEIIFFGELLKGALSAEEYQLLKMNVSSKIKEKIIEALPSLLSPTVQTINKLASEKGYAIETVVKTSELADLIIKLRKFGAKDILVLDINVKI